MKAPDGPEWFAVMGGAAYTRISFAVVALYRARIEDNHGQTLERLNERGGLDWYELWCGFADRPLFPSFPIPIEAARADVLRIVQSLSRPEGVT